MLTCFCGVAHLDLPVQRGNPLGSLVYTSGFPSNNGNNNSFQQVIEWHKCVFLTRCRKAQVGLTNCLACYRSFMGSNLFCFKACDPSIAGSKEFCNNIFDLTGCAFVAPAAVRVLCRLKNFSHVHHN